MTRTCHLVLEIPVERSRYTERWPTDTGRLLVYVPSARAASERCASFCEILAFLTNPCDCLYGTPLGLLIDDKRLRIALHSRSLSNAAVQVGESTWLFDCGSADALEYLLGERHFERVAFFWTRDLETARTLVLSASGVELGDHDGYEMPLLKHAGKGGGFIFYSSTHDNLEVLGTPEFVFRRCFEALLPWAKEDQDALHNVEVPRTGWGAKVGRWLRGASVSAE